MSSERVINCIILTYLKHNIDIYVTADTKDVMPQWHVWILLVLGLFGVYAVNLDL